MHKKEQLDEWDKNNSWHPFSQMQEYCQWPQLHLARGQGCWLWDTEGNRYLDTNASVWTNTFGHNDPDLNDALKEQLAQLGNT
ncbi:MAG: aminotransferase class III-fold pyridoxal phosphate-dependent enzyme [Verrucomicrobia bacterium]|nr:aminotransferase class III-fold pyridoxal phosphate-dependent enzyme [Verrucomicrobiota bacterium]